MWRWMWSRSLLTNHFILPKKGTVNKNYQQRNAELWVSREMTTKTPLARWMWEHDYHDTRFAMLVEAELRRDNPTANVSSRTVAKWRAGAAIPRPRALRAVMRLTGLSADDLVPR